MLRNTAQRIKNQESGKNNSSGPTVSATARLSELGTVHGRLGDLDEIAVGSGGLGVDPVLRDVVKSCLARHRKRPLGRVLGAHDDLAGRTDDLIGQSSGIHRRDQVPGHLLHGLWLLDCIIGGRQQPLRYLLDRIIEPLIDLENRQHGGRDAAQ